MSGYDWDESIYADIEAEAHAAWRAERPPRVRAEDVLSGPELEDYYAGGGR